VGTHLIFVITRRILRSAHDQLSTFGIGADIDEQQWHSVFRQLVTRGLVAVRALWRLAANRSLSAYFARRTAIDVTHRRPG